MPHAPIVEVDWPNNDTWTDVTRYVRDESGIRISRGRGDEQDEIQPGTMSLTLHNDGRFTPGLASGAYYPNVRKGRPIRCRLIRWTTNMLTNSSFETDTAGWSAAGTVLPALTRSTTRAQSGAASLLVAWGTGGTGPAARIIVYGFEIGEVYTVSAYVYVPSGGSPAVRLGVVGLSTGTASSTTNAFQRISYTFTATDTWHVVQVTPNTAPTSGHQVWVDAVQVERGSGATTYSGSDATISARFLGRVGEWPVQWADGPGLALSSITATDLFRRLGGLAPMRSLLEEEMLYLQPDAYYTLGEQSGATSGGDTSGKGQRSMAIYQIAGAGGSVGFGTADGPGTDDLPAPTFAPFSSSQGKGIRANLDGPTAGAFVMGCWLSTSTVGRDFLVIQTRAGGPAGVSLSAGIEGDGTLRLTSVRAGDYLVGGFNAILGTPLADGKNHFVALLISASGNATPRIDDTTAGLSLSYGSTIRTDLYDRLAAGGFRDAGSGFASLFDGVLSHVWFKRVASMPAWADVWSAGNGLTESTTARFARLCRLLGLTGTTLGSSSTQIDPQAAGGKAPLQALRDVAGVEAGLVYASRSAAEVVLECRAWRYNKVPSISLTASDIWDDLQWSDDDQPLANDVTNRRDGGADQRVTDAVSIAEYGACDGGSSQPWASDDDALADAQWRVYKGADPPPRITQVTLAASILSSYATVLGLDLSDVVRLTGLPSPSPVSTMDLHIEGYDETISLTLHMISFNTSPAAPNRVWLLGTAGFGELGTNTRLAL
ncbi:carbohydrate binding domain-containing protein [Streptosporangium sp. NPDC002544]|uniref:carbohydrate binding domain-containing protein n=1 Tax=Streptosporangium sp. NPDC002544 TaxID=3154538 RepID=UPI00331FA606